MAEEILSQAEIDALLQMIGEEAEAGPAAWQPGEREALERLGRLLAEAIAGAWRATPGLEARVEVPAVDQVAAGGRPVSDGPGVWAVASLGGAAQGQVALWLGGRPFAALAAKVLGRDPGAEPLPPGDVEAVGRAMGAAFVPLAGALGELAGTAVPAEPVEAHWATVADAATVLAAVPGFAGALVRLAFPCRLQGAGGELILVWRLEDARAFLARVAAPAPGAAAPGAAPAARGDEVAFQPLEAGRGVEVPQNIDLLLDVPLALTVELGRTERPIREILALAPGSVVELERLAGEPVDVLVNGKLIARGEVVVVDENFGVRITEIVSRAERVRRLR